MPIYEVEGPDGRVLEIEGDTMPTENELNEIFSSISGSNSGEVNPPKKETPGPEELIKNAMGASLAGIAGLTAQTPASDLPGIKNDLIDVMLGGAPRTALDFPGQTASAGMIGANFAKGANIAAKNPEILFGPLASAQAVVNKIFENDPQEFTIPFKETGLAEKFLPGPETIPGNVASLGVSLTAPALMSKVPGVMNLLRSSGPNKYEQLTEKAQKLTTELLQPSKARLEKFLARGEQLPAIEEAAKAIISSKNYEELAGHIDDTISEIFTRRNEILKTKNKFIGSDYVKPLRDLISAEKARGQATPSEIGQMEDVLRREIEFLKGSQLDRVTGQARKEYFEDITERLLQKTETGQQITTEPARIKALDALRKGLRKSVEAGDSEVAAINSRYGGLLEARRLIAGQQALAQKAVDPTIAEKIVGFVMSPFVRKGNIPGEIAKVALNKEASLSKITGKIQALMKEASLYKNIGKPTDRVIVPKLIGDLKLIEDQRVLEKGPKLLTVSPEFGEGFVINSREKAVERIDFQLKKILEGLGQQKALPAPRNLGEGFELVTREEAMERLRDFARKFEFLTDKKLEIPFSGTKKAPAGTNVFGDLITDPIKTAKQKAMEKFLTK